MLGLSCPNFVVLLHRFAILAKISTSIKQLIKIFATQPAPLGPESSLEIVKPRVSGPLLPGGILALDDPVAFAVRGDWGKNCSDRLRH